MTKLTAIILAAGQGKRIKPITTPKSLMSFLGKPLIEWIIDDLKSAGIKNFILVVNPSDIDQYQFLDNSSTSIITQKEPKGMADALLSLKDNLETDSAIVVNGDDLLPSKLFKDFIKQIKKQPKFLTLTGLKIDQYLPGGYFKMKDRQAVGIIEKPDPSKLPSQYVNLVLQYFPKITSFIDKLSKTNSKNDDVYEVALNGVISKTPANLVINQDYFAPMKYPHHLLDMTQLFLSHRLKKKPFIHPTAKIMSGAVVKNSYIGENVTLGNNVLVRDSIIEKDSVVGYNTEIARSYVGPNSWFHCNYVGDSVIEGDSNMGSGTRLANYRFDSKTVKDTGKVKFGAVVGRGVKFGINSSIMPGVNIGANSLIGAGIVLNQDVPENSKVYTSNEITIK